ncbi:hypothetical protein GCM10028794_24550 [Silanimonas algicola]
MPDAPLFALGLALACLAGVRAYLTVFGVGIAALLGWMPLPAGMEVVTSPWVLGTAGALAVVEFFADKIPGVDSAWDLVNTLARVPAGAFLASAAFAPDGEWGVAAAALGGAAALSTHALKSSTRVAINASPEPVSNWVASGTEDVVAAGGLVLAILAPIAAAFLLAAMTAAGLYLGWRLVRGLTKRQGNKTRSASQV